MLKSQEINGMSLYIFLLILKLVMYIYRYVIRINIPCSVGVIAFNVIDPIVAASRRIRHGGAKSK